MEVSIDVKDLHKAFRLPHERHSSLKQTVLNIGHKRSYENLKVLDGVTFDVKKGEFFGIVGRNGSGKSTLLKVLAGIYTATSGSAHINGQLTPFIELGVGFNPELTGRDNVFLNGAIFGLSRKEVEAKYNEIVAFAELEKFMDQKLKNYSSGMQVRLAFSIAIQARTEVLLIDEVLAVGDESFQRKCLDVFDEYKRAKRTVVLVTHDMESVRKFCDRAILIHSGKLLAQGSPRVVAREYEKLNDASIDSYTEGLNQGEAKQLVSIGLTDEKGQKTTRFEYGQTAKITLEWEPNLKASHAGLAIYSLAGEYIFGTNTLIDKVKIGPNGAAYEVQLSIGPGRYYVVAAAFGKDDKDVKAFVPKGPAFTVDEYTAPIGQGLARLDHNWKPL